MESPLRNRPGRGEGDGKPEEIQGLTLKSTTHEETTGGKRQPATRTNSTKGKGVFSMTFERGPQVREIKNCSIAKGTGRQWDPWLKKPLSLL